MGDLAEMQGVLEVTDETVGVALIRARMAEAVAFRLAPVEVARTVGSPGIDAPGRRTVGPNSFERITGHEVRGSHGDEGTLSPGA